MPLEAVQYYVFSHFSLQIHPGIPVFSEVFLQESVIRQHQFHAVCLAGPA